MNPHFIFNALTNIQTSILKKEHMKAVGYLSRFSKLVRNILESSSQSSVPLTSDIGAIIDYLELQKIRYETRLNYTITIDESIESDMVFVPPMLFQPLVENAIEHGVNSVENGIISIRFTDFNTYVKCEVTDNGVGYNTTKQFKSSVKKSLSTQIIKSRLAILSKKLKQHLEFKIEDISSENQTGTLATLDIPLIQKEDVLHSLKNLRFDSSLKAPK